MAYPYIPTSYHGGGQTTIKRVVIHATVSPTVKGGARSIAKYFASPSTGGSAHYVVDPGEIIQCVKENVVAYHAPPNTGTIGIELCDPQKGASSRWSDAGHEAMLKLAAKLVREVVTRHGVPLKRLTVAQVKAGQRGICGHVDVSNAFGQTDHSDPGTGFPWAHFVELITGSAAAGEEDDMDPSTKFKISDYWKGRGEFSHDTYDVGFLWTGAVSETRTYGKLILAKLEAQQTVIESLAAAVAVRGDVDPDEVVAKITAALEKVTVKLDVPDGA